MNLTHFIFFAIIIRKKLFMLGGINMKGYNKYFRGYFMPPVESNDWVKKEYIDAAPIWCSVDLRDGNQSRIKPMSLDQKFLFFKQFSESGQSAACL